MPRHSGRRFVLEVLFLAGTAAALTAAHLRPAAVIVLMVLAWVIVALLEWTAWIDEPHYGRGLPPRYYVPHVALPPPRAVEQGEPAYPVMPVRIEDEPTFVASTTEWAAGPEHWPELDTGAAEAETAIASQRVVDDDGITIVPLPPLIHPALEDTIAAEVVMPDSDEEEAPAHAGVAAAAAAVAAKALLEPEPEVEPEPRRPAPRPVPAPPLAMPAQVSGIAVHRVDPLVQPARRRLFRRGGHDAIELEVTDGPPPDRTLPLRVLEEIET
jgi:hypothetical protein